MDTELTAKSATDARQARARVLAAIGDPIRLGIVDQLTVGDRSPDQLAADLGIAGNLLAHHLNVLEDAGVIQRTASQSDRRRTYVQLREASLDGLLPASVDLDARRVVFVCTHNSARSILADAAWRQVSDVPSASAGTAPAARIHPRARAAARRAGLTIGQNAPQALDEVLRPDDVLVSVCDGVNELLPPSAHRRIHWSIPDPSRADTDAAFTAALTEITHRVNDLAPRVHPIRPTPRRRA